MTSKEDITVRSDTFDLLERNKPTDWDWDKYLRELLYPYHDGKFDELREIITEYETQRDHLRNGDSREILASHELDSVLSDLKTVLGDSELRDT